MWGTCKTVNFSWLLFPTFMIGQNLLTHKKNPFKTKYNNNLIIINLRSGPILAVLIHSSVRCLRLSNIKLEVTIDYGSAFVRTYGKITETIDKINRVG